MPISSDRLIKKFFVAGYAELMPLASDGFSTFEEALERAQWLQEPGHGGGSGLPVYIYEAFVVELPAS